MCHFITAATVGARSDTTVVFVDSGGSFSAGRVLSMLTSSATLRPLLRSDLDPHEALSRIQHVRCFSVFAAVGFLESVLGSWGTAAAAAGTAAAQRAPPARPSLIIVDSVGQLLSPIVGQGGFATMGTFAELLIEIARAVMIPVAVNTSVSAGFQDTQPDSQEPPGNQPAAADLVPSTAGSRETMTKPALGAMWDAVPTFRLFFTQSHDDGRAALYRVYDHDAAASAAIAEQLALTMAGPAGDPVRVVRNHVELLDGPSKQLMQSNQAWVVYERASDHLLESSALQAALGEPLTVMLSHPSEAGRRGSRTLNYAFTTDPRTGGKTLVIRSYVNGADGLGTVHIQATERTDGEAAGPTGRWDLQLIEVFVNQRRIVVFDSTPKPASTALASIFGLGSLTRLVWPPSKPSS
nr:hypothetical protein HK105_006761 [Polyrhizophydium stewartii]